ncbi:MAG: acyltransferase family protein [Lachnospiraceae bacterium]
MIMLLIPLLWLGLVFAGGKKYKEPVRSSFSKEQSLALRGICAMEIVMGHLGIYLDAPLLRAISKADILFVGIFFALSGYGIAYSIENKQNYLRLFPLKKFVGLFLPAYIAYVLGELVVIVRYQIPEHAHNLYRLSYFFENVNWFIWELFFFYLLTYFIAKIKKLKQLHWILLLLSVLLIFVGYFTGINENWYGSGICFPLGIIYYYYSDCFYEKCLQKKWWCWGIAGFVALLFFAAGFLLLESRQPLLASICKNIVAVLVIFLLVVVLSRVKIGNSISYFLGSISFEIYLYHLVIIGFCRIFVENVFLCALLSIVATIFFSFLAKKGNDWIRKA